MGRITGWGRRPHLIQHLLQIVGEGMGEYDSELFILNANIGGKGMVLGDKVCPGDVWSNAVTVMLLDVKQ